MPFQNEARKFGVYFKTPLRIARELCPHAAFLPADHKEYVRVSERIKDILGKFCPIMEDAGIDETFLDISHIDKPAEEIAKEIKNGGFGLSALIHQIKYLFLYHLM